MVEIRQLGAEFLSSSMRQRTRQNVGASTRNIDQPHSRLTPVDGEQPSGLGSYDASATEGDAGPCRHLTRVGHFVM